MRLSDLPIKTQKLSISSEYEYRKIVIIIKLFKKKKKRKFLFFYRKSIHLQIR